MTQENSLALRGGRSKDLNLPKEIDPAEFIKTTDLRTIYVDGGFITKAESILDSYSIHDPAITKEQAREAARWQMVASMALDARHGTNFQKDRLSRSRLEVLGVNPDTLELNEGEE